MNLFSPLRECLCGALARKKTLIAFAVFFSSGVIFGLVFVTAPLSYEYALDGCGRYLDLVVYSTRSVFVIFLERTAGRALLLLVIALSGVHLVCCVLPPAVLLYRSYTMGASLYIFFSVYGFSGALTVFLLYLPVHLAVDAVLLFATAQAYGRAARFGFGRDDFLALGRDALCLFFLIVLICLAEMLMLLIVFHPIGNIL